MELKKIVRSICYFSDEIDPGLFERLHKLTYQLEQNGYEIQTKRVCFTGMSIKDVDGAIDDDDLFVCVGSLKSSQAQAQLDDFINGGNNHFNLDITSDVTLEDVQLLFDIIKGNAGKTFNFTYSMNVPACSPFFPSANFERVGFSIGLQSTDLSIGCETVEEWLDNMVTVWNELMDLFSDEPDFIGVDSSIAPLGHGDSSFVDIIERLYAPFPQAVTSDVFTRISSFIKVKNPEPVGLCGLMFPCLEDAGLARYYEQGGFSLERNLFLSLHCGLGIDTYPIGIDEKPERVLEVLQLVRALSNRYHKPLAARFISDGTAKIGDPTILRNKYLEDVTVRAL